MKRIAVIVTVALVLVLSLGVVLAGCTTTATPDQIKKDGTLIIATNAEFPPFEYIENGKYLGWDMDIASEFAKRLGVEISIENMEFDSVLGAVATGKAHIAMAGISKNPSRDAQVDFSDDVFDSTQVIIVKADDTSINGPMDLAGKRVGVQRGTVGDLLANLDPDWAYADGELILGEPASVDAQGNGALAVQNLVNGSNDAVIIDRFPAEAIAANYPGQVKILETPVLEDSYAFAVAEGNKELADWINKTIAEMKEDGTWDTIMDKHFGSSSK